MYIKAVKGKVTPLGRLGENEHMHVGFDVQEFLDEYPDATFTLLHKPHGTLTAYPVPTATYDGTEVLWTVTSADLTREGRGKAELLVYQGSVLAKSETYDTEVRHALDGSGPVPDGWETWQQFFAALKNDAETAARLAQAAAQTSTDMAGVATEKAGEAAGSASEAASSAESALASQTAAALSESHAAASEVNAASSAESAARSASAASGSATSAGRSEANAAASETAALTARQDAQQAAQSAGQSATQAAGSAASAAQSAEESAELKSAIESMGATASTLPEGSQATVNKQVDPSTGAVTLAFGIPRGDSGDDGVSPTISITDITGGHRVTITDATGAHSFDVMDGDAADAPVHDVQVNGVSVLSDGVANVPIGNNKLGAVKIGPTAYGLQIQNDGEVRVIRSSDKDLKAGTSGTVSLAPNAQHKATFYGLAKAAGDSTQSASNNAVGAYTESAKSKISDMLNAPVSVSGTTPTINALPGIRYVCGEVATLDITLPASGCVDVVFESGSTPTVLTITPPTGVTLKWANGFDPTALDANTTYEINIADGLGVAGSWT